MERMWIKAGKVSGLQWGESVHLAQIVACCTIFSVLMDKTWPGGAVQDEASASSHNQSKCSSSLLLYIIPHSLCTNGTCSNLLQPLKKESRSLWESQQKMSFWHNGASFSCMNIPVHAHARLLNRSLSFLSCHPPPWIWNKSQPPPSLPPSLLSLCFIGDSCRETNSRSERNDVSVEGPLACAANLSHAVCCLLFLRLADRPSTSIVP